VRIIVFLLNQIILSILFSRYAADFAVFSELPNLGTNSFYEKTLRVTIQLLYKLPVVVLGKMLFYFSKNFPFHGVLVDYRDRPIY